MMTRFFRKEQDDESGAFFKYLFYLSRVVGCGGLFTAAE